MSNAVQYSIKSSGGVAEGHEPDQVISEFCSLFGVKEDRAAKYIAAEKLIKKDLSEAQANAYRDRFMSIGLPVTITPQDVPDEFGGMSLMPANEPVAKPEGGAAASGDSMTCPKCDTEQPQAPSCNACGIILEKFQAAQAAEAAASPALAGAAPISKAAAAKDRAASRGVENHSDGAGVLWLAAAIVIAIVGAFIWKYIAVSMDRELAIVAWLIGAAIGGGAAMLGSEEDFHGIVCAALVVLAIVGGKYMAAGAFVDEWQNFSADEEMSSLVMASYQYEAETFATVGRDEQSIKEFMTEGIYTQAYEVENVTDEEYAMFVDVTMPMLIEMHENPNSVAGSDAMESVMQAFTGQVADISQGEMFKGMWGLFDILFIFLGVGSAYKLASGRNN